MEELFALFCGQQILLQNSLFVLNFMVLKHWVGSSGGRAVD
jgi:hypothetical protein